LDACSSIIIGEIIVIGGEVVRPSQLIASVRWTIPDIARGTTLPPTRSVNPRRASATRAVQMVRSSGSSASKTGTS
jgi:hypothetical protein